MKGTNRGPVQWFTRGGRKLALVALMASVLAGCSSNASNNGAADGGKGAAAGEAGKKPTITLMNTLWVQEAPKPTDPAMKIIQEATGVNLDINWVPGATYGEKLNAVLASGDMPQVLLVGIPTDKSPGFINAVRSGMFWEVGPYLKDYPNLSKLNEDVLKNSSIDGKQYGLYRARAQALTSGIIIRKDWMDKLALKAPANIDEFYELIKKFSTSDPDGNGQADTFGIAEHSQLDMFKLVLALYGGPNVWEEKDGKFTPDFMTPAYKQAMNFVKRLYDEKLMNQDFAALQINQKKELLFTGKTAMYVGGVSDAAIPSQPGITQEQVTLITGLSSAEGRRLFSEPGYDGLYVFPKTSVKTEEELKQILSYFDKLNGPEVTHLLSWGIEGEHYALENGVPKTTDGQRFENEINPLRQLRAGWDIIFREGAEGLAPIRQVVNQSYLDNAPYLVQNPAYSLISDTFVTKGNELAKITSDAQVKYIMGAFSEADFDNAVKQWREQGGDQIIQEYEAAFAAVSK